MNDYFMMWEAAQEWNAATEELRESVRAAVDTGLRPAITSHEFRSGVGIVLILLTAALLWMIG